MTECQRRRYEDARLAYAALMKFYPFTLEDLDDEQWADIAGYEGLYQVSTFGRVKSFIRWAQGKILSPSLSSDGYLIIVLQKNCIRKHVSVQRLVAMSFVSNPDNKSDVNHCDGHKLNNYVDNLEWVSRRENINHAWQNGLNKALQGQEHYCAKLTNEQVLYIRDNPDALSTYKLAEMFKVSRRTITDVQCGRKYKNVAGKIRQAKPTSHVAKETHIAIRNNAENLSANKLAKMFGHDVRTVRKILAER